MFSDVTIALLFSVGFLTWVYSKLYHTTGGNTKHSLIVAGCAGVLAFFILWSILGLVF